MSGTTTVLWRMSALELAEAIRCRHMSSQEVIEVHLQRIEAVNPSFNAVTVVLAEQALEAAKAADRAVTAGGDLPPFYGVPFTVKGNIDLAGTPTTQGRKRALGRVSCSGRPCRRAPQGCGGDPHRPHKPSHWHESSLPCSHLSRRQRVFCSLGSKKREH
jgi:amidase